MLVSELLESLKVQQLQLFSASQSNTHSCIRYTAFISLPRAPIEIALYKFFANPTTSMSDEMERPPPLLEMFISSVDTLRKREINQKIAMGWNERPPLFRQFRPKRQRFWQTAVSEEIVTEAEDPTLLKGVSSLKMAVLNSFLMSH